MPSTISTPEVVIAAQANHRLTIRHRAVAASAAQFRQQRRQIHGVGLCVLVCDGKLRIVLCGCVRRLDAAHARVVHGLCIAVKDVVFTKQRECHLHVNGSSDIGLRILCLHRKVRTLLQSLLVGVRFIVRRLVEAVDLEGVVHCGGAVIYLAHRMQVVNRHLADGHRLDGDRQAVDLAVLVVLVALHLVIYGVVACIYSVDIGSRPAVGLNLL